MVGGVETTYEYEYLGNQVEYGVGAEERIVPRCVACSLGFAFPLLSHHALTVQRLGLYICAGSAFK